jgi:hypothetical protein
MALFFVAAIVGVILMNKNDNKFRK